MKAQYKNPEFTTPDFLQAIQAADFEAVKDLVINKGANVNALDNSMIPVFAHAIYSQNTRIIDFFLEQGAHINSEFQHVTITPLGAACKVASLADSTNNINYTFGKLVDLGANLNPENCLSSPLTEIIKINGPCSEVMAQYLVKLGANINPTIDFAITPLAAATQVAIQNFTLDPISTCLGLGAQINPINPTQASSLVTVARSNTPVAKIIAKYLIANGAEVQPNHLYSYNCPLYQAVGANNKDICELLIEKDVDLNNFDNSSLSELLIRSGNLDMLQYLMSKGMKLSWDKALEISLSNSQPSGIEMTKFLLSKAEKYDKKELLIKAINYQNQIITNLLMEENGAIDLSDYQDHFNLTTPWSREIAIKLNHPASKILNVVNSGDIDEIFQITKTLITSPSVHKANAVQVLELIKKEQGPKLIKKVLNDHNEDVSKAIKNITLLQLKYTFKNDKFVLTTQTSGNEATTKENINIGSQGNLSEIKEQSKTYIKDKKVYLSSNDKLLDDNDINNVADCGTHYVVNKNGTLFVNAKGYGMCHSYFLKGTEGKTHLGDIPMYGYGKPVACGGHIKFKDGLITKITNGSGHYMPNSDQLKLVCKHFKDLGVLSKDVVIEAYSHGVNSCVKVENSDFLDSVVVGDILEQYPEGG